MPECSLCSKVYDVHKGLSLVLKDGTVKHLCSSKCRKNLLMKRRKIRWISKTRKEKAVDQKSPAKEVKEVSIEGKEKKA